METFLKYKFIVITIFVVVVLGATYYFKFRVSSNTTEEAFALPTPGSAKATQDLNETLSAIDKLMELPKGDQPSLATVADKDQLKDEPFFDPSQNGDKVVIFPKAQLAILYRPSSNKIVSVSPISSTPQNNTPTTQTGETKTTATEITARIAIYNGSNKAGLATTRKNEYQKLFIKARVSVGGDAKGTYDKPIVVPSSAKFTEQANAIAQQIGATVQTTIPTGESLKNADIYIIAAE